MESNVLLTLFNNATLLLVLSVIYEVTYFLPSKYKRMRPLFSGLLISFICVAVMSIPFTLQYGVIFDTRSILISVEALIFGPIPTIITVIVASIFRISLGGIGTFTGLLVIINSAIIGLVWRKWLYPKSAKWPWLNVYAMGIVVHVFMLLSMLSLPYPDSLEVIGTIIIPVLIIYPIATVLLTLLLMRQENIRNTQNQLIQSEHALRESERSKSVLLSNLPGMAYRCNYDRQWTMQFVSAGCLNLTGYSPESLLFNKDLSFDDLISPEYREPLWEEWGKVLAKKQSFSYEYEIVSANGERKWVLELGEGIFNSNDEVEALEGIILDITDRKKSEDNLLYLFEHDEWTGLFNRESLERLLEKDIKEQTIIKRALISINLNAVQLLAVDYGFQYTQNLIKNAADKLQKFSSDKHLLFKTYENRFVYYIREYEDKSDLVKFSEDVADVLEGVFVTDRISGGLGILEIGFDNQDVDQLLKRLLIASEKSISISEKDFKICFYDDRLEAEINREFEIRKELYRISLDERSDDLFLEYQPILDLKTDRICGFEALARLKSVKLGIVSPSEFIPIAEETKLIIPLGEKIMKEAFGFLKKLNSELFDDISVAINISAIQLLGPDFSDKFLGMIKAMGVDSRSIEIEITESVFSSDFEEINLIISKLREEGIRVSIDDFGTGYSSLAREKELNVDCLKIDKYFIDKLLETDYEKAITSDIISIAHKLGHYTIAEGVEFVEQKKYLLDHGCDMIQGFLVAAPLSVEKAIKLLGE